MSAQARSLCERVAKPVLALHRRTSSPIGTAVLAAFGAGVAGYGLLSSNLHLVWLGGLVVVVGWYGFLLHGCDRMIADCTEHQRVQARP